MESAGLNDIRGNAVDTWGKETVSRNRFSWNLAVDVQTNATFGSGLALYDLVTDAYPTTLWSGRVDAANVVSLGSMLVALMNCATATCFARSSFSGIRAGDIAFGSNSFPYAEILFGSFLSLGLGNMPDRRRKWA